MAKKRTEKAEEKKTKKWAVPALLVILVGVAFGLGVMWSKIKDLQTKKEEPAKEEPAKGALQFKVEEPTGGAVSPTATPAVLGQEQMAEFEEGAAAVKGKKDAPITIVEFSEYECPYCKRYVDDAYAQIWQKYGDKIRYVFHDYPLPFHKHAQKTAEAARCAGDQGKYWEMHDLMFKNRDTWAAQDDISETLAGYARQLGLKTADFEDCLTSGKQAQAVKNSLELGKKFGVQGTPTFFVNGQKLVGAQPFESFKAVIEAELEKL